MRRRHQHTGGHGPHRVVALALLAALTAGSQASAVVVNASPAAGATGVAPSPTLEVVCSPIGFTAGQFQVASEPSFAAPVYDSGTTVNDRCAHVVQLPLAAGTPYYWRARLRDSTATWTPWSTATSFTTTSSAVTRVTLRSGVNGYAGCRDVDIRGDFTTMQAVRDWDQGAQDVLRSGRRPAGSPTDEVYRSLLVFDLPPLDPSRVLSAHLELTGSEHGGPNFVHDALNDFHRLLVPWGEGDDLVGLEVEPGECSWSYRFEPDMWTVPGAAGIGSDRATGGPILRSALTNVVGHKVHLSSAALVLAVGNWLDDPSTNHGLVWQSADESFRQVLNIAAHEHADPAFRPRLAIDVLACSVAADCDDGVFCNGAEACQSGACYLGTPPTCDDGVACTGDACDVAQDICVNTPDHGACDDGAFCNGEEVCAAAVGCQSGSPACDDAIGCTVDTCDEALDSCANMPSAALCDDGVFCNGAETCDALLGCQPGSQPDCDDGVPCTLDSCDATADACTQTPDHSGCDDGLFCNGAETCHALLGCVAGIAVDCDDGVSCTADTCDEALDSCAHDPMHGVCSDGVFCNGGEQCDPAQGCVAGAAPDCDDGIACTVDVCNQPSDACVHTATDGVCDDGLFCNGPETCDAIAGCLAGAPVDCSDGIGCTADTCNELSNGCDHEPDHGACDDGLFCNGAESCDAQAGCGSGVAVDCNDGIACTIDTCDEVLDVCDNAPDHGACTDGVFCNGSEVCDVGSGCGPGAVPCPGGPCDEASAQCCSDDDGDGVCNAVDACPGFDDAIDGDGDGAPDACDNCPQTANAAQDDCDDDGIGDGCAVAAGVATDCNGNGFPDGCESDCNCNGSDDALDLLHGTSLDCNSDGVPDECTLRQFFAGSGQRTPVGSGIAHEFLVAMPPSAAGAVTLTATARGDLGSAVETLAVTLNDVPVGTLFALAGDCPAFPDVAAVVMSATDFNNAVGGADAVIRMTPSPAVDQALCDGAFLSITVSYDVVVASDCNGNGVPDECDVVDSSADCDANGVPDECQIDCNGNGIPATCEPDCCTVDADCTDLDGNAMRDDACQWWECVDGGCAGLDTDFADLGGLFGACTPDGFVNVHDRNHALTCFAGVSSCEPLHGDAGGPFGTCPPDGFCNIHDANHALAAFSGASTCLCPSGPAPFFEPVPVETVDIALVPERAVLGPNGTMAIEVVLASAVRDLRSIQFELAFVGGRRGGLELLDVRFDDDSAFARSTGFFSAVNATTPAFLAGLEAEEGMALPAGTVLATLLVQATDDANGAFEVDIATDAAAQTYLVASGNGRIAIRRVDPAAIRVTSQEPYRTLAPRR